MPSPVPAPNHGPVAGPNIKTRLVRVEVRNATRPGAEPEAFTFEVEGRAPWTAAARALRHFIKTRKRRLGRRVSVTLHMEAPPA